MWHTCQVCQEQKRGHRSQATGNREPKPKVKTFTTEDTKDTEVSDLLTVYRLTYRVSDGEKATLTEKQIDLIQGTLHLLILKSLALGEMHGLGISRRVEQITNGTFQVKPGSLFPALHRMEEAGWLAASWGESENGRRAKYYQLTKTGRRQLKTEADQWTRVSLAIALALQAT